MVESTTGKTIDVNGVDHPAHYNTDISGVECIDIVRYMNFNQGNAFKYLFRAGRKFDAGDTATRLSEIRDLEKAIWYLKDERKHGKTINPVMDKRRYYEEDLQRVITSREGDIQQAMILLDLGYFETSIDCIERAIEALKAGE